MNQTAVAKKPKKQIISKDGKVYCYTTIPYPSDVIKQMKKAGYKVKEVE